MSIRKLNTIIASVFAFLMLAAPALPAQALTYSEISQGKVLGDSTGFYPYPTGTLVNDSGTIYFISGTTKVPFTNWQAFVGLGYGSKAVVVGDLTNYTPSANYVISTANAAHPWGSWLIYKGTVYYSTQDGLIGVPSAQVFTSNGGDWTYIVKANSYDVAVLNSNPNLPILTVNDSRVSTTPTYQSANTPTSPASPTTASAPTSNSLQISAPRVATGTVGQFYSMDVPYTYSGTNTVTATWSGLPNGVTGQSTSANEDLILSGTPTQAGTYTVTLQLTDGISTASQIFTITVNSATSASTVSVSPGTLNFTATVGGSAPAVQYVSINPGSSTAAWTAEYPGQNNPNVNANLGYNGAVGGTVSGTGSGNLSVYLPGPFTTAGTYNDYFIVISGGQTQTVYITLTVTNSSPALSVNLSSAMASPVSLSSGTANQRIASFQISANSASAANINSITLDSTRNTIGSNFQNLVAMVSRSQVGATQSTFASNGQYTFNFSSPLVIPAGGSAIVDVYLDVSSSVNSSNFNVNNQNLVSLNSLTGTWAVNNSAISAIAPVAGQTVVLATSSSLQISPSSLSFSASVGGNPPNLQYFYITPVSSSNNSWTAEITSSSIPTLYLSYGTVTAEIGQVMNGSGSATIQVGSAGPFTAGNYTGTITITSGGQTQTLAVSLAAH